jgi:hypothetical protein
MERGVSGASSWKQFGSLANSILREVERKRKAQEEFVEERAFQSGLAATEQRQLTENAACPQVLNTEKLSVQARKRPPVNWSEISWRKRRGQLEASLDFSANAFPLAGAGRALQTAH